MSFQPIQTALKYVIAWGMVAAFVALLTLIFSFLGTLFCAALGGMMMGATGISRRLSVFYSLLCPGVLLVLMHAQKSEIPERQRLVLLVISLVAFWVIYLVAAALMAQEHKDALANGASTIAAGANAEPGALAPNSVASPGPAVLPEGNRGGILQLAALDGYWRCEVCGQDGRALKRVLEIKDGRLVLSTVDSEGNLCACVRGRLNWIHPAQEGALAVSAAADEEQFPSPAI